MMRQTGTIRQARYAGTWYPETREDVEKYIRPAVNRRRTIAAVCPHAGWMYSGMIAGDVYAGMAPASLYVLIGPNHTGLGDPVSVFPEGRWETPLGDMEVDAAFASELIGRNAGTGDTSAHLTEHSLEVQLPFIKLISPDAKIVPVTLADYRPSTCRRLGEAVAAAAEDRDAASVTLIASSDMSHYVPADYARRVDRTAIDRILALDPDGLLETVAGHDISMCGSGPVAAVLTAAGRLGATTAELVRYGTSGDVTGDDDQVVGYAGVTIF